MPQLVALAVVGAGLFAGYRWLSRVVTATAENVRKAEEELRQRAAEASGEPKDLGRLELDPRSGVYKPVKPD